MSKTPWADSPIHKMIQDAGVDDGSSLASSECSALRDSAIELWDMATTAAVRSMNGEWSDKRVELQTVLFTEKLREIISQNESEPPTEDDR